MMPEYFWIRMKYLGRCSEHPRPRRFFPWSGANQVEIEEYFWLDANGNIHVDDIRVTEEATE